MEKVTVNTTAGLLEAYATSNGDYPGIYVRVNGQDLVLVEYDKDREEMVGRIWTDLQDTNGADPAVSIGLQIFNKKIMDMTVCKEYLEIAGSAKCGNPNCKSHLVSLTGIYRVTEDGFYVEVICDDCGKTTETGDDEFFSKKVSFDGNHITKF